MPGRKSVKRTVEQIVQPVQAALQRSLTSQGWRCRRLLGRNDLELSMDINRFSRKTGSIFTTREKNCLEDPSGFMLRYFSPIAGTSDPCLNIGFSWPVVFNHEGLVVFRPWVFKGGNVLKLQCLNRKHIHSLWLHPKVAYQMSVIAKFNKEYLLLDVICSSCAHVAPIFHHPKMPLFLHVSLPFKVTNLTWSAIAPGYQPRVQRISLRRLPIFVCGGNHSPIIMVPWKIAAFQR